MLIKVRTLTGKEIELDIEPDYKVRLFTQSACALRGPTAIFEHPAMLTVL